MDSKEYIFCCRSYPRLYGRYETYIFSIVINKFPFRFFTYMTNYNIVKNLASYKIYKKYKNQ